MSRVYISMGSNLGNRAEAMAFASEAIFSGLGNIICHSSLYETEPWGFETEFLFLNQVLLIDTKKEPLSVLGTLQDIENKMGRERSRVGYHSRTLDLDILFYDNLVIQNSALKIPHPLLHLRRFVLVPLCEIAGDMKHPVSMKSIKTLLKECKDEMKVTLFENMH
jgi:2-amino-4-hydroxy-6-hydroxymethyldihydropteridine diphosphokinase